MTKQIYPNRNPTMAEKELWKHGFFLIRNEPCAVGLGFDPPWIYEYARSQLITDESSIEMVEIDTKEYGEENIFDNRVCFHGDDRTISFKGDIEARLLPAVIHRSAELGLINIESVGRDF